MPGVTRSYLGESERVQEVEIRGKRSPSPLPQAYQTEQVQTRSKPTPGCFRWEAPSGADLVVAAVTTTEISAPRTKNISLSGRNAGERDENLFLRVAKAAEAVDDVFRGKGIGLRGQHVADSANMSLLWSPRAATGEFSPRNAEETSFRRKKSTEVFPHRVLNSVPGKGTHCESAPPRPVGRRHEAAWQQRQSGDGAKRLITLEQPTGRQMEGEDASLRPPITAVPRDWARYYASHSVLKDVHNDAAAAPASATASSAQEPSSRAAYFPQRKRSRSPVTAKVGSPRSWAEAEAEHGGGNAKETNTTVRSTNPAVIREKIVADQYYPVTHVLKKDKQGKRNYSEHHQKTFHSKNFSYNTHVDHDAELVVPSTGPAPAEEEGRRELRAKRHEHDMVGGRKISHETLRPAATVEAGLRRFHEETRYEPTTEKKWARPAKPSWEEKELLLEKEGIGSQQKRHFQPASRLVQSDERLKNAPATFDSINLQSPAPRYFEVAKDERRKSKDHVDRVQQTSSFLESRGVTRCMRKTDPSFQTTSSKNRMNRDGNRVLGGGFYSGGSEHSDSIKNKNLQRGRPTAGHKPLDRDTLPYHALEVGAATGGAAATASTNRTTATTPAGGKQHFAVVDHVNEQEHGLPMHKDEQYAMAVHGRTHFHVVDHLQQQANGDPPRLSEQKADVHGRKHFEEVDHLRATNTTPTFHGPAAGADMQKVKERVSAKGSKHGFHVRCSATKTSDQLPAHKLVQLGKQELLASKTPLPASRANIAESKQRGRFLSPTRDADDCPNPKPHARTSAILLRKQRQEVNPKPITSPRMEYTLD
ncbi:unnamed protein product [Amoebophrya sp. A120]|nr:unnamed protein product [Amoebophrya sp. A120]|eukprot:GSA120T00000437001.1